MHLWESLEQHFVFVEKVESYGVFLSQQVAFFSLFFGNGRRSGLKISHPVPCEPIFARWRRFFRRPTPWRESCRYSASSKQQTFAPHKPVERC